MNLDSLREVYFCKYCDKCEHKNLKEHFDPCNECLAHPFNEDTHRPVFFKEKD